MTISLLDPAHCGLPTFGYVERVRRMGVAGHASIPLFGCLMVYVMNAAGWDSASLASGVSVFSLALLIPYMFFTVPLVMRSRRDGETSTENWAVVVVWVQLLVTLLLYSVAIVKGGAAWSLIGTYTCHRAMGVFVFWRILMRQE